MDGLLAVDLHGIANEINALQADFRLNSLYPTFGFCFLNVYVFSVLFFLPLALAELFQWQRCWLEVGGCTCLCCCGLGTPHWKPPQCFQGNFLWQENQIFIPTSRSPAECPWRGSESLQDWTSTWFAFIFCMSVEFLSSTVKGKPHSSQWCRFFRQPLNCSLSINSAQSPSTAPCFWPEKSHTSVESSRSLLEVVNFWWL